MIGRNSGFSLDAGYEVAYDYDDAGRLDNVSWTVEDKTGSVSYTRLSNADLLEQMSFFRRVDGPPMPMRIIAI